MSINFTRKAYLEVWRDNEYISRHTSLIEAGESASRHADDYGSGDYYITIGGPPESFTQIMADGLPHNVQAGKVYYMARADVTIRFSEGTPIFAYPVGAQASAASSAVSANSTANDIAVNITGASIATGSGILDFWLLTIPPLTIPQGSWVDMSQYIVDGQGRRTGTNVLNTVNTSYSSVTERLTGDTLGTDAGLQMTMTTD